MERSLTPPKAIFACVLSVAAVVRPAAGQSSVMGDQKTLVIVANLADRAVACSVADIQSLMFDPSTSVAALFKNNSLGKTTFSGEVVGPYTLSRTSTDECNLSVLSTGAEQAASNAGVDVNAYPRRVYVLPSNSCSGGGNGTIGGSPSRSWIYACDLRGVYVHNLGHNLGLDHASTAEPLTVSEYGDGSDPMGWADNALRGLNAPHRHQLGWLAPSSLVPVTQGGSYNIAPLALDPVTSSWPQVLTIPKPDTAEYYYLSYREPVAFDSQIDGLAFHRLSIHRSKADASSTRTHMVARLDDGQNYLDVANGLSVTLISHNSTYATVLIQFSERRCVTGAPSLTVSPAAQSGTAGGSRNYSVSLTNNDSVECAARTFGLNAGVPAGWSGTLSASGATLQPTGTAPITLTVSAPSIAPAGSYPTTVTAIDTTSTASVASAVVTYTVEAVADILPPTTPQDLKVQARQKQVDLSWSPAADNIRVTGYRISRDGMPVGDTATPGWVDRNVKAGATYTYSVAAYDAAGNVSAPSAAVSLKLPGSDSGGGGGNPKK